MATSHSPLNFFGAPGRIRTCGLRIRSTAQGYILQIPNIPLSCLTYLYFCIIFHYTTIILSLYYPKKPPIEWKKVTYNFPQPSCYSKDLFQRIEVFEGLRCWWIASNVIGNWYRGHESAAKRDIELTWSTTRCCGRLYLYNFQTHSSYQKVNG